MHDFLSMITPARRGISDIYPELELTIRATEIVGPPVHTGVLRILNPYQRKEHQKEIERTESELFHQAIIRAVDQCNADRAEYLERRNERRRRCD